MKKVLIFLLFIGWGPVLAMAQNIVDEDAQRDLTAGTNPLKTRPVYYPPVQETVISGNENQRASPKEGANFLVNKVIISGNTLFSAQVLLSVLDAHEIEGNVVSFKEIQNLADRLTAYYQSHGYTLSYAYIPLQKLIGGVLTIRILEVRVGQINVTGNRWFSEGLFKNSLNLSTGDYFKMTELTKALNRINSQPDHYAKVYLEPGQQPGTTDIQMKVTEQMPFHASYEYNLRGSPLTGRYRNVVHLTDNNLTGRGDIIQASLESAEKSALFAEAVHYEFPIPRSSDVVHVDFSDGLSRLQGQLLELKIKGSAISFIPGYTHTFWQTDNMKLDGDIRFELKDSKIDELGSDKLSFDRTRALVGGPRITFNDGGGRTAAAFDLHVGIPDFMGSSTSNDPLASRPDTGGKFVYETMNVSRIEKLPDGMLLLLQASGQYSHSSLTSLEQMYLGGMYSVRGYPENDSAGDSGFSFSEEVRIPVYLIPEGWKVWGLKDKTWRQTLSLAAFVDEGRVFNNERLQGGNAPKDRTLLGAGPGIRFYVSPDLNMQFDLGFPFGDTSSDKHGVQPHLSARVGF
jgi:hemolysin activation/secretion protein